VSREDDAPALRWDDLTEEARAQLSGRLGGLYGREGDGAAFDALPADKQRALLIFARRFARFGLGESVKRVTNVYGEGGVGIEFVAAEDFEAAVSSHPRFTPRFAGHGRETAGGFYERRRASAALHFLRTRAAPDQWAAHFDLHGPLAGPVSFLRHLWHEVLMGRTPGWRSVLSALGYGADLITGDFGARGVAARGRTRPGQPPKWTGRREGN
jgi:hypothetical protein